MNSTFGSDICRFQFSSKERDASTGFSYYGYRFYAPQWQRWVNRDPLGESGGINLYGYVFNSPLNLVYPFGLAIQNETDRESCFDNCYAQLQLDMNAAAGRAVSGNLISTVIGGGFVMGGLFVCSRGALIPGTIVAGIGAVGGAVGVSSTMNQLAKDKDKAAFEYQRCLQRCQKKYPRCEPKASDYLKDHPICK